MKKLYIFLIIFSFFSTFFVFADKNYISEKVIFLPQDFYVGDAVELRVKIIPKDGLSVAEPKTLPDLYWIKIEKAEVVRSAGEYEFRISLKSYAPGIRALPPITFGDITLKDIRIQTKSILEDDNGSFSPIKDQMLLPGTTYYFALFVGILFLLPVFIIAFWSNIRKYFLAYIETKRREKAYKKMNTILKYLQEKKSDLSGVEFFTVLVEELKLYLSDRGHQSYFSATARECSIMLSCDFKKVITTDFVNQSLILADEVKFGDRQVSIQEKEEVLRSISHAVDAIEKYYFGGENVGV